MNFKNHFEEVYFEAEGSSRICLDIENKLMVTRGEMWEWGRDKLGIREDPLEKG